MQFSEVLTQLAQYILPVTSHFAERCNYYCAWLEVDCASHFQYSAQSTFSRMTCLAKPILLSYSERWAHPFFQNLFSFEDYNLFWSDAPQRKRNKVQTRCRDCINYRIYVIHACGNIKPHVCEHDPPNKNKNKLF